MSRICKAFTCADFESMQMRRFRVSLSGFFSGEMQGLKEVPAKVNFLLSTGLALSIGLGAILPPAVQAEDSVQKRREDMERRKELLAKT